MSGLTERFSAATEDESVLDLVGEYYHVPLLAVAVIFSLWIRTRGWRNFLVGDRVLYSGNDAWYHLRTVTYTVKHWPFTMPFDPWTAYPVGNASGQFGTLYDQLVATAALIVGLGSPTETQIAMTHLFAPAVFGALALVPAYLFASRVSNRGGGLVAVLLLTLTTGQFLTRGVVGFSDHHIAEVFFLTLAAYGVAAAVSVAEDEKPVYELVTAREWDALRRPVAWGAIAGLFIALYLWTWPPGVFLLGVLGVFFAVAMSVRQVRGASPDHLATVGIVMGLVVGVLTLLTVEVMALTPVELSLLQPTMGFALAGGAAFLAWLARVWDDTELPTVAYPVGVLVIGLVVAGVAALAVPETFDYFVGQVLRIFGHTATAQSRTVAEAKPIPLDQAASFLMASYGLAIYTALGAFALMLYEVFVEDDTPATHLFLLVLAVFLLLATLTQQRFDYYFAIPVAALNGYLAVVVFRLVDLDDARESLENVEAYQVMAVLAVLLVVVAPLAIGRTAPAVAEQRAQPGEVTQWTGSLDWMQENTPAIGAYGTGGKQSLEYYGTYPRVDDFDYDQGEYGTLAWWDYGHFITVLGHRIPNANPFQQNAKFAANALLAPNESTAVDLLREGEGAGTQYVVIDYPLGVAGTRKFSAPTAFETMYGLSDTDTNTSNDVSRRIYDPQSQRFVTTIHSPRSYESLRVRLYQFHGSRASPADTAGPVFVFDYNTVTEQGRTFYLVPEDGKVVKPFQNVSAARQFVKKDRSSQIGGLAGLPSHELAALEHFRLVHASRSNTAAPGQPLVQSYPWVKTFERVPGANVTGEAPANTTVSANVTMRMTAAGKTFSYEQQARTGPDGTFTMTLPYATTGYEKWGTEEGYTNVSVRATGPYTFATPGTPNENGTVTRSVGTAHVPEGAVIGENESTITVDLEREVRQPPQNNGTNATNATDGTGGNETGGNGTDGGGDDSAATPTGDNASESVAPPLYARPAR